MSLGRFIKQKPLFSEEWDRILPLLFILPPFFYIANELDFNQHQATTSDVTELIFTVGGDDDDVCVSKSYQVVVPSELNPSHQVRKNQPVLDRILPRIIIIIIFAPYSILEQ